jgi:hypothetical protein
MEGYRRHSTHNLVHLRDKSTTRIVRAKAGSTEQNHGVKAKPGCQLADPPSQIVRDLHSYLGIKRLIDRDRCHKSSPI